MRTYRTPDFQIGDKVAYSVQFLKSVGMSHSDMAHARGVIVGFTTLWETKLVSIEWDRGELPYRVNAHNLAKVGPNPRFANVD